MGPAIDTNTGIFETIEILQKENERLFERDKDLQKLCASRGQQLSYACQENGRLNKLIIEATRQRDAMFEHSAAVTSREVKLREELEAALQNERKNVVAWTAKACETDTLRVNAINFNEQLKTQLASVEKHLDAVEKKRAAEKSVFDSALQKTYDNWTAQVKEEREKQAAIMLNLIKSQKENDNLKAAETCKWNAITGIAFIGANGTQTKYLLGDKVF